MRLRQVIIFLLIVLVPLAIAAWLGLKVAQDEEQVSRHRTRALLEGRLRDVAATIARTLGDAERGLLERVITADRVATASVSEADVEALRALRRSQPLVREIFVLGPDGRLAFPPHGEAASQDERAFRERTAAIWRGDAVLYEPPSPEGAPVAPARPRVATQPFSAELTAQGDTVLALAAAHEQGWITWYWEEGLHLLLWRRAAGGGVIGVEVERVVLLARIVGKLPAAQLDDGRVVLVDSRGNPMHQWGPYEPARDEQPVATLAVHYPLNAWRLLHYVSPAQTRALFGGTLRLNLIIGLAAVALALLGMAFYFYRDYSRKMRDAAERVSFVTQVSHELKTPLTNIRLYAELIEGDLFDEDDKIQQRLSVIVAESQRLTRLINNILAFSKHRRRQLDLHRSWIQLDDVIASVIDHFAPALNARSIAPTVSGGADAPIYADPDVIGQIVANLISNVEKYAHSGGVVDVTTAQDDHATTVRVADRGPGIPASQRDKVFRPFYRVSDRLADGVTGTGIGLSIARELARLSGGDLRLVASDVGACFELTLPRDATPEPQPKERRDEGARS